MKLPDHEDRGYNNGTGHAVMPSGQLIAVGQTQDQWAKVVLRLVYDEHVKAGARV